MDINQIVEDSPVSSIELNYLEKQIIWTDTYHRNCCPENDFNADAWTETMGWHLQLSVLLVD